MKNIAELLVSYINLQYLYDIITVAKIKKHFLDYILLHVSAFVFWAQQSSAFARLAMCTRIVTIFFSQNMCLHARTFHTV